MKKSTLKFFLVICFCLIISPVVFTNPFDEPSQPLQVQIVDWGRAFIELKWEKPERDGGSSIKYYWVEAKLKNAPYWYRVVETVEARAIVEYIGSGNEVQFRIIAVNAAGPSEPSEPTEPIVVP